jgi:hypothetical protein
MQQPEKRVTAKEAAAALGMARTTYQHRIKHNLPLSAPVLSPSERVAKATATRIRNYAIARQLLKEARESRRQEAERQRHLVAIEREEQRRLAKLEREAIREAKREARRREQDSCWKITALPLDQISNPWTAGRRRASTTKPTAPTTSAVSASTACGGLKHGN